MNALTRDVYSSYIYNLHYFTILKLHFLTGYIIPDFIKLRVSWPTSKCDVMKETILVNPCFYQIKLPIKIIKICFEMKGISCSGCCWEITFSLAVFLSLSVFQLFFLFSFLSRFLSIFFFLSLSPHLYLLSLVLYLAFSFSHPSLLLSLLLYLAFSVSPSPSLTPLSSSLSPLSSSLSPPGLSPSLFQVCLVAMKLYDAIGWRDVSRSRWYRRTLFGC